MPQKKLFELVGMAAHNITVVPNSGPRVLQSKWPFDASHSWNNWFYYNKKKNNTREGEGRNILYRDATRPRLSQTGKLFFTRDGGRKKKSNAPLSSWSVTSATVTCLSPIFKKEKAATPFALLKNKRFTHHQDAVHLLARRRLVAPVLFYFVILHAPSLFS